MNKGEIRTSTHLDQVEVPTTEFIEQVIEELVSILGEEARQSIYVSSQELESEHQQQLSIVESNNVLTIIWHNSTPAALVLETRDEYNRTDVHAIYMGPKQDIPKTIENSTDEESYESVIDENILDKIKLLKLQNNFGLINDAQFDTQLRALQNKLI